MRIGNEVDVSISRHHQFSWGETQLARGVVGDYLPSCIQTVSEVLFNVMLAKTWLIQNCKVRKGGREGGRTGRIKLLKKGRTK